MRIAFGPITKNRPSRRFDWGFVLDTRGEFGLIIQLPVLYIYIQTDEYHDWHTQKKTGYYWFIFHITLSAAGLLPLNLLSMDISIPLGKWRKSRPLFEGA